MENDTQPMPTISAAADLDFVSPLTAAEWRSAVEAATSSIRALTPEPDFEAIKKRETVTSAYPKWAVGIVLIVLAIFAFANLYASWGKQIIVTQLILEPLAGDQYHLPDNWINTVIQTSFFGGEAGAIAFGIAAAMFASRGRWARFVFRAFSIISAASAIVASLTVALTNLTQQAWLFEIITTLAQPGSVLGVAFFFENWLLESLAQTARARMQFMIEKAEWDKTQNAPGDHPQYKKYLRQNVIQAVVTRQSPSHKRQLNILLNHQPRAVQNILFQREWARFEGEDENPTQPPPRSE